MGASVPPYYLAVQYTDPGGGVIGNNIPLRCFELAAAPAVSGWGWVSLTLSLIFLAWLGLRRSTSAQVCRPFVGLARHAVWSSASQRGDVVIHRPDDPTDRATDESSVNEAHEAAGPCHTIPIEVLCQQLQV